MSKRSSTGTLYEPATSQTHSPEYRANWLAKAKATFNAPDSANAKYYGIILDLLWPDSHGLPGPAVSEKDIRARLDEVRVAEGKKPYVDPFRRMRELQGDEGFTSIVKSGTKYQLQSTDIGPKREPRSKPRAALWRAIKAEADGACSKCGLKEPEIKLSPDHRIPRSRGGSNDDPNWQPLCVSCNTLKSVSCQNCTRLCNVCYWAYPERYAQLDVADTYRGKIREEAEKHKISQNEALNKILKDYFRKY